MIFNYYFFIGTTAELIKLFPVLKEFQKREINFKIISSGQNDLYNDELLKYLNIQKLDIVLYKGVIRQNFLSLFFWFFKTFFKGIFTLKKEFAKKNNEKSCLIVHGDTVSTVMGALIGRIFRLSVAHLEAGLRSNNYLHPFPEEIDRVITSYLANWHFCPNRWAVDNLKKRKGIKINTYQNTLLDSLQIAGKLTIDPQLQRQLNNTQFYIFIIHRQENVFNKKLLFGLLTNVLNKTNNLKCLFILHDLTRASLEKFQLLKILQNNKSVIMSSRLPYFQFIPLLFKCEFIITDGGSNQEETSYIGKPCLLLRKFTERIEGLNRNVMVSNNNLRAINDFIDNYKRYQYPIMNLSARPSEIIADNIIRLNKK